MIQRERTKLCIQKKRRLNAAGCLQENAIATTLSGDKREETPPVLLAETMALMGD